MPAPERFAQLALRFADTVQYDYEIIRGILVADETIAERSRETGLDRAVVQERETGSLVRKPVPGRPRAISRDQEAILRARLEAASDATVLEHCAWWEERQGQQLSETTMWRAIRRLGWTHKKRCWQPASATRRHARPGGRRSPS